MKLTEFKLATIIATVAHAGQFRRDGVTPYITHPLAVAEKVSKRAKPAALLHDTVEDSKVTFSMLRELGINLETLDAIILLTKNPFYNGYLDYISTLKNNTIACEVKIADIEHNLASNPNPKNIEKYKNALVILKNFNGV